METNELGVLLKTPVSLLNELFVKKGATPHYKLLHEEVGHNPLFIYEVTCLGKTAVGRGKSKREAKHAAAETFLKMLNINIGDNIDRVARSPYADAIDGNATGSLQEFCVAHGLCYPVYTEIPTDGPPHTRIYTIRCCLNDLTTEGSARTKKGAKHIASYIMLKKLNELPSESGLPRRDNDEANDSINRALELLCRSFGEIEIPKERANTRRIFNFEDALKEEPFISSDSLKEIRGKRSEYFDGMRNPLKCFKKLMQETKLTYEVSNVSVRPDVKLIILCIQIKSFGNATFWGEGVNDDSALQNAALNGLKWFAIMSVNIEKNGRDKSNISSHNYEST